MPATGTSSTSSRTPDTRPTRPIRSPSRPNSRPAPRRSSPISRTSGTTTAGCAPGRNDNGSTRPSRSTRRISVRGGATNAGSACRTAKPAHASGSTRASSGSRTSSCCRSWSTRSSGRGGTRRRRTSRRARCTAAPPTSWPSSTRCTAKVSACCSTGCRRTFPLTILRWHASTAPISSSTPIPSRVSIRTGTRWSSTTTGTRCDRSWSAVRASGSIAITPTGCESTRSPRCSISTTRVNPASGSRTSTAGGRTSARWRSCAS